MVLATLLVFICNGVAGLTAQNSSLGPVPRWVVDLRMYGWHAPVFESDKVFFKDLSLGKLEALDDKTRIIFVSNDVLVGYHTKKEGQNWRTADRKLEAFFLRAADGSLLSTKLWPTTIRKAMEAAESESRIVSLQNGRFLVVANGNLMIYSGDLNLIKERKLEPFGPSDFWGIQRVAAGHEIFLRHERLSDRHLTYQWIDAGTFQLLDEMPGDIMQGRDPIASAKGLFLLSNSGIREIGIPGQERMICNDPLCREDGSQAYIAPQFLGISSMSGIGVLDPEHGLLWSDSVGREDNYHRLQFGDVSPALAGERFAVCVWSDHKFVFDSVVLPTAPKATVLVYNALRSKHVFAVTVNSKSGQFDYALSPDGKTLAIFDGGEVRSYDVN